MLKSIKEESRIRNPKMKWEQYMNELMRGKK